MNEPLFELTPRDPFASSIPLDTPGPMHEQADEGLAAFDPQTALDIFHGYIGVLVIAFLVTLLATPLMRKIAISQGVIDRPNDPRKIHKRPVAYLGGVAVFLGLMAGILFSYLAPEIGIFGGGLIDHHETQYPNRATGLPQVVPYSVLLGMTIIMLLGLIDDVVGVIPRLKIAGMLVAAAALALDDVGVQVARGLLAPTLGRLIGNEQLTFEIMLPLLNQAVTFDLIYWTGTAVIALFVLGACNASNLIDGLDGLLTGVTGVASFGLLIVALSLAVLDDGPRDAQRIVLCMALLGACLGFLPHNFNPATIFLGDCGSLLMGFVTITIILSLGDTGKTQLVVAGLVIYSIPIIDTVLAIVRRKLARKSISEADDQHLHHMLKRSLGVKGAALSLYGIGVLFALVGVAMTISRARITYFLAIVFVSYIIVVAIKIARRQQWEEQASRVKAGAPNGLTGGLRPSARGAKPPSRRPAPATEAARPPSPPPASG
ncbi:MAG: undecaprenyl/decaprenyl-phosphate alpha-N-acetylglucosaminyl 1-phosphate transferase [Phycisphaerales bacterium]|nr:undecaprenyl/decaprenyl-phosphate alpha-N-acetylglucosaminyl 1-phosphate transferase [Phycisphaerales bacterium]